MYYTLNCRGKLLSLEHPKVMGVLNLTPDSFSDGGQNNDLDSALIHVDKMIAAGVDIVDVGGYSSRPYADVVSESEEIDRIFRITEAILHQFPEIIVSIDTFRARVAKEMLELGAHMINDISGGALDPNMMATVASYDAPYIGMHMQGRPENMQDDPHYNEVISTVYERFLEIISAGTMAGIKDIVLDPGFGFGKSLLHNYQLLAGIDEFEVLAHPILVGVSRKSMLYKLVDAEPGEVIALTSALHLKLLEKGADIIRVHDVEEARQVIQLFTYMQEHGIV